MLCERLSIACMILHKIGSVVDKDDVVFLIRKITFLVAQNHKKIYIDSIWVSTLVQTSFPSLQCIAWLIAQSIACRTGNLMVQRSIVICAKSTLMIKKDIHVVICNTLKSI